MLKNKAVIIITKQKLTYVVMKLIFAFHYENQQIFATII